MSDDIVARYENVSKDYDGVKVVSDLTFDIRRGEFLSLLGPSGSGKTTTLMMLAGLQSPSSGNIFLDGRSSGSRRTSAISAWCSRTTPSFRT